MNFNPVTKGLNKDGVLEYHLEFDSAWDGVESFARYLQKHWDAEVVESVDDIYSRRWVLRSEGVPITIYHDSQIGNYYLREDGIDEQTLLEKIEADLIRRMS